MPTNTITTALEFTTIGELSDAAIDMLAALLVDSFLKSQTPASDSPDDAGFNSGASNEGD